MTGRSAGGFTGFGEGAVEFFDGLEADNSKAYWTDRREVYESDVRVAMQALLAALEPEFGTGKIFRPHRDVRFSADKTPYKTHCGATVGGFYLQVGADGLMAAAGHYQMASDQVARYRTAVDDDRRGADLERRLTALADLGVTIGGELLKTRPRGVDPRHPRLELMRHRSLFGHRTWAPDDVLHEAGAQHRVAGVWRALRPLTEWLDDHVGASDQPRR